MATTTLQQHDLFRPLRFQPRFLKQITQIKTTKASASQLISPQSSCSIPETFFCDQEVRLNSLPSVADVQLCVKCAFYCVHFAEVPYCDAKFDFNWQVAWKDFSTVVSVRFEGRCTANRCLKSKSVYGNTDPYPSHVVLLVQKFKRCKKNLNKHFFYSWSWRQQLD